MDSNKELQEALFELCQATVKVMRIAYNGDIPSELLSNTVKATLQHLVNITDDVKICERPTNANAEQENQPVRNPNAVCENKRGDNRTDSIETREVVYGHNPINRGGQYVWTRLSPDSDEQRYKITKLSDGTAEFELITLSGEKLNAVWMSKGDSLPNNVVTLVGEMNVGATLKTTTPGKGLIQGKSVVVQMPCIAEFRI